MEEQISRKSLSRKERKELAGKKRITVADCVWEKMEAHMNSEVKHGVDIKIAFKSGIMKGEEIFQALIKQHPREKDIYTGAAKWLGKKVNKAIKEAIHEQIHDS